MPPLSDETVDAFSRQLPKLLVFADEKIELESRFGDGPCGCPRTDLSLGFNKQFGRLLLSVYQFSLYEELAHEVARHSVILESRGMKQAGMETVLSAWIMGIQSLLPPHDAAPLVAPLRILDQNMAFLCAQADTPPPVLDDTTRTFMDYILQKNRKFAAETLLKLIREGRTVEQAYRDVLLPALRHIARLWRKNDICVADEYAATDICRYVMFRVIDSIFGERRYPFKALVTCMPEETDMLGGEIFANYLEIKGWSVYFIGQAGSGDDILHALQKTRPQVIVLSVMSITCLPAAGSLIEQIRSSDQNVKIVTEGHAARIAADTLAPRIDGTISDFEKGNAHMLSLVMPDA